MFLPLGNLLCWRGVVRLRMPKTSRVRLTRSIATTAPISLLMKAIKNSGRAPKGAGSRLPPLKIGPLPIILWFNALRSCSEPCQHGALRSVVDLHGTTLKRFSSKSDILFLIRLRPKRVATRLDSRAAILAMIPRPSSRNPNRIFNDESSNSL